MSIIMMLLFGKKFSAREEKSKTQSAKMKLDAMSISEYLQERKKKKEKNAQLFPEREIIL